MLIVRLQSNLYKYIEQNLTLNLLNHSIQFDFYQFMETKEGGAKLENILQLRAI